MTTPPERTRALRQAGELVEMLLAREDLPDDVRRKAEGVARHYPTAQDIELRARHWESQSTGFLPPWLMPEDLR